ncbi:PilZ domain-containing protein [Jiella sp. M17.18]|uniref:PilZ domain-containing protein n=1 Tax=Jiella sp. M17.18 TaxID=3234247 RepID=UPI0034DFF742
MQDDERHPGPESRAWVRRRTRLRPVKLASLDRRFLDDGMAFDMSQGGARIRHYAPCPLPGRIMILDEADGRLRPAAIVWTRGLDIGVRFLGPERPASRADLRRLTGRYYAV